MPTPHGADWLDSPQVQRVAFHPRRERSGAPARGFEVLDIPVADQVTVGARFYSAGPDRPTLLFFHGNGEIVADYDDIARLYVGMGMNFLPVDYRGYGRSSGQPSIGSMLADARAVFDYARQRLASGGYTGPLVVMGRSLGSASALEIAATRPDAVDGLILDSAFSDIVALLDRLGARLPTPRPEDTQVRQTEKIAAYAGPTLILHGTEDRIIPVADAEALRAASPAPSMRLIRIRGAGHNNLLSVGFREYTSAISEFMRGLLDP